MLHLGAYFDPGMEFGDWFDRLSEHTKEQCEAEFDRPFSGTGIRIIKSHVFAHHIDFLKQQWPDCPIILAHRNNDAALGWWVKCGEFNISYPLYRDYYKDLRQMAECIRRENEGNRRAAREWPCTTVQTNLQLSRLLGLKDPPQDYRQDYTASDIKITVI